MTTMLSACASPGGPGDRVREAAPPVSGFTPVAFTSLPASFCDDAAASDHVRLQMAGFDAQTVDRFTRHSLQQCRVLWAGGRDGPLRVAMR